MRPPGTDEPRRYLPRFHWELLACGVSGHELVGTRSARLRPEDELIAREMDGVRWYRCLRCDSWLPLEPPAAPEFEHPPERGEIELPLRGRPLRDKIVLRAIAIDRGFHFVVLGMLCAAILLFAANQRALRDTFYHVVADVQEGLGPSATRRPASSTSSTRCSRCAARTCTCSAPRSAPMRCSSWSRRSACGSPSGGRST